ncbi:unnamed protein product [Meganyctiphanes norvegica]|uniref:Tudor domain-containing protein 7 n=1 Tax=Meganyctiphanes norvegica TaxID=48144 RepID=A0AAV2Q9C0_MEGNR
MASKFLKLGKSEENFNLPSFISHGKKEYENSSNNENASSKSWNITKVLQTRIFHLLKAHSKGIQIERFPQAYTEVYDEYLYPSDYGFTDLVDLLTSFSHIVSITVESHGFVGSSDIMLHAKSISEDNYLPTESDHIHLKNENLNLQIKNEEKNLRKSKSKKIDKGSNTEKLPASAKLPSKVLNAFNTILNSHNGGIAIDFISSEYKYYAGEKLEPSRWGFTSLLDMLSKLSDIFSICEHANGEFILCTASKKETIAQNNEIIKISKENSFGFPSLNDKCEDIIMNRKLPLKVQRRLKSLFEDYFPSGLEINEIVGAYRGFYGAILEDLNHLEYGYLTLEAFLQDHNDLLNVKFYDKNIMVFLAGNLKVVSSSIEFPLPACSAVLSNESYTTYNNYEIIMKSTEVDFFIGEVYSPSKFHVMLQGEQTSEALNALMDQIYEFYNSAISERYKVKRESMIIRTPVVALYSNDMNWYRAIIISFNNINTAKLFLVDYGTTCSCPYTALRLLHRNFLKLPAQAKLASLYGIKPINETLCWSKSTSKIFKQLVQNKYLHSRVHKVSENLVLSLWDDNISINELLVSKGFAIYKDGHCSVDFESSDKKNKALCSSDNFIVGTEINSSNQFEIVKEPSNFDIKRQQEIKDYQLDSTSENGCNIDPNEKEIIEYKVINWLKNIDINENNYIVNSEKGLNLYQPQEEMHESLKNSNLPGPSVIVEDSVDTNSISAVVSYCNNSDMEQLNHGNRNNHPSSMNLEDSDHSIDEFLKKRKVELVNISPDKKIHIVYLSGEPYMLSTEISGLLWDPDELPHQLKRKEIDVPHIVMKSSTHADIFTQLSRFGIQCMFDESKEFILTVTVYPLETTLKILNIFKCKDVATMNIIEKFLYGNTENFSTGEENSVKIKNPPKKLVCESIMEKYRLANLRKLDKSDSDLKKSKDNNIIPKMQSYVTVKYNVPKKYHASLIGTKRRNVKRMEKSFNVEIIFPQRNEISNNMIIIGLFCNTEKVTNEIEKQIQRMKGNSSKERFSKVVTANRIHKKQKEKEKSNHLSRNFENTCEVHIKIDLITHNMVLEIYDENFSKVKESFNVHIQIIKESHSYYNIIIKGKRNKVLEAELEILECLMHISEIISTKMGAFKSNKPLLYTDQIKIPFKNHVKLIGKNGSTVDGIRQQFFVDIHIPPKYLHSDKVFIRGNINGIEDAKTKLRFLQSQGRSIP